MDPRHLQRIEIVQNLFAYSFGLKKNLPYSTNNKTKKVIKKINPIDKLIKKFAPRYPLDNIAKTDLAILRLSIYELAFEKKTPKKVIVNESVELAKELSGEKSYAFVNAVMGKVLQHLEKNEKL